LASVRLGQSPRFFPRLTPAHFASPGLAPQALIRADKRHIPPERYATFVLKILAKIYKYFKILLTVYLNHGNIHNMNLVQLLFENSSTGYEICFLSNTHLHLFPDREQYGVSHNLFRFLSEDRFIQRRIV
jgi:hypothetical protein